MSTHLAAEAVSASSILPASHPMDSSRVLLNLMRLSRRASSDATGDDDPLQGIISQGALRTLLSALHFRDPQTMQHSRRVGQLAVGMAEYLGWEGRQLRVLEIASLLHDVGKIGVPDNVLCKPGKLGHEETELISVHHNIVIDILQACRVDKEVLDTLGQCYDLYSGSSVSSAVQGRMNQGARILTVADAYDSISRDQAHRRGRSHPEVMAELRKGAGTQFDGNVVAALERWVGLDGLPFDEVRSGEDLVETPSPVRSVDDALDAHSLCHIFSYLYLLESLYDGFYVVDSDLRCLVWSRGAEKLLGHPARQMLNQSWTSRMLSYADGERPLPDSECPLRQVIETSRTVCRTARLQRDDGQWLDVEISSFPLFDEQGHLQGAAEILRDAARIGRRPGQYRDLKIAASRDSLTQLANRGELETQLTLLVAEYDKADTPDPFSVVFADVDYFKSINDNHGHGVGDQVLVDVARLLQNETYSGELVARFGGEEFVVICPSTALDDAVQRAERLRNTLAKTRMGGSVNLRVTASFGVAEMNKGDSVESVLRRADKGLYMAKESGRNKTCSLTVEELENGAATEVVDTEATNPFVRKTEFSAVVAEDMVVYKLGGFVNDNEARLLEVTPERTVIRLGRTGLLPFWGRSESSRPVLLVVELENAESARRATRGSSVIRVTARVTPLGWVRKSETFQARARRVLKTLRSYFVVND